ncbi:hypothetical protein ENBRE01_2514 [Enteropsectra breve]|nr:hypothetical protein ENBRE01_2514 [Enteropsectra breve]
MVLQCIVDNRFTEFAELALRQKIHSDDLVAMLKYGRDGMLLHYYQCCRSKTEISKKLRDWVLLYDNLVIFQAYDLISYRIDKSILLFNIAKGKIQIAALLLDKKPKLLASHEIFLCALLSEDKGFANVLLSKISSRKLFSTKAIDCLLEQKHYPMLSELLAADKIPKRYLKYLQTKMFEEEDTEFIHVVNIRF